MNLTAAGDLEPAQLDRLSKFVGPLLVELESKRERRLATEYVGALLGPSERKTVEPMVRTIEGRAAPSHERRMTEMLADGEWGHRSLTLLGAEHLLREFPQDFAAYTLDDTAALKQGKHSVGVANQYAGCVGGLANCQAIVTAGIASEHVSTLIAAQLFLPESWCVEAAADRRAKCRVPLNVKHRTKAAIGLDIVRDVAAWGLPKLPWLADSAYGDNTAFRHALDEAGQTYVAGASLALSVWPLGARFSLQARATGAGRPPTRLVAEDGVRPIKIAALATSLPTAAWSKVVWRQGSRGPQRGRFAAVRVRPARGINRSNSFGTIHPEDLQPEQWLLIHWPEHEEKPTKAWLSNLPDDTDIVALITLARLRWRIERDHEESKGLLGLDHYEGRTWRGLHHHLALVLVAEQFLALERLREAHAAGAAHAAFPP
jgi:SRSO17 transposase